MLLLLLLTLVTTTAANTVHSMSKHTAESKVPIHSRIGEHFLNQLGITISASSEAVEVASTTSTTAKAKETAIGDATPVYISLNVRSIRSIDASEESYQLRCHLYLMWGVDFNNDPEWIPFKESLYDKAVPLEYYPMGDEEVVDLSSKVTLPSFRFANAKEATPTDDAPSLRVYANDGTGMGLGTDSSYIMWNQGFELTLSSHFPLHDFPFDSQDLLISIRQDDSRSWDKFNLTMAIVQFNKEALAMAEWKVFEPHVSRGSPGHKEAQVFLHVKREPGFFVVNVCAIIGALCATGLVVFALGTDDLNDRINVILTLLLTAVAFKFVIADAIPKVGYSTLIDDFVLYNMAFLFGQLFLCIVLHKLEHGGHDDDDDDEESPSHLMATHLSLFHLTDDELELRKFLKQLCAELDEYDVDFPHGYSAAELKKIRKLRQEINDTKDQIHEKINTHWTVNQFGFAFSIFVFLTINLLWFYNVSNASDGAEIEIVAEKSRNWYAFSYANPSFLPTPGDDTRCTVTKNCPAGW